jgi:hypothetical protein
MIGIKALVIVAAVLYAASAMTAKKQEAELRVGAAVGSSA